MDVRLDLAGKHKQSILSTLHSTLHHACFGRFFGGLYLFQLVEGPNIDGVLHTFLDLTAIAAREDFMISRQMRVSKNDGRVYGKLRAMSLIFSMCTEKKLRLGERLAVGVQLTPERGNL